MSNSHPVSQAVFELLQQQWKKVGVQLALKNLSLIGALFVIAGYGRGPRSTEPAYGDV